MVNFTSQLILWDSLGAKSCLVIALTAWIWAALQQQIVLLGPIHKWGRISKVFSFSSHLHKNYHIFGRKTFRAIWDDGTNMKIPFEVWIKNKAGKFSLFCVSLEFCQIHFSRCFIFFMGSSNQFKYLMFSRNLLIVMFCSVLFKAILFAKKKVTKLGSCRNVWISLALLMDKKNFDQIKKKPNAQCWTEGRSSTAVAEDLRPTATVAEV